MHTCVTLVGRVGKGIVVSFAVSHPGFGACYFVKVDLDQEYLDEAPRFVDDVAKLECGREEHLKRVAHTTNIILCDIYTFYYVTVMSACDILMMEVNRMIM